MAKARFGDFELDLSSGELRRHGARVRLQALPFQVLSVLLEKPGEVTRREELCRRLWPPGVFVDFEQSLTSAVKRLRDALRDAAENPHYIETVARGTPQAGYRFIAPVELVPEPVAMPVSTSSGGTAAAAVAAAPSAKPVRAWERRLAVAAPGFVVLIAAVLMLSAHRFTADTGRASAPHSTSPTTVGVFRLRTDNKSTADRWLVRYSNTPGIPDRYVSSSVPGAPDDIPVVGNWCGPESASVGVFRPAGTSSNPGEEGLWFLGVDCGRAPKPIHYGAPGDMPVVGDWTGSGRTSIGVFRPAGMPFNTCRNTAMWLLRTNNAAGNPDLTICYGHPGDRPVVGDWDGDGITHVGVFRQATAHNLMHASQWELNTLKNVGFEVAETACRRDPNCVESISVSYGGPYDLPVVGDWNGKGKTTIGVYLPPNTPSNTCDRDQAEWELRLSNTPGPADIEPFCYGALGDVPVVGKWSKTSR